MADASATLVLSGGNFGGVEVPVPTDGTEIRMTDELGRVWVYDRSIHDNEPTAHFVRMEPASS